MHPAMLAMLGMAVLAALTPRRARATGVAAAREEPRRAVPDDGASPAPQPADVRAIIVAEAKRQGLEPRVALAFAQLESGLNPDAEGDLDWAYRDGGKRYRELVWASPRLTYNPARGDPGAWHSYGLFQLNAAHFVQPDEHPRVLLDPWLEARRRYVGCAPGRCSAKTLRHIDAKWHEAIAARGLDPCIASREMRSASVPPCVPKGAK